MNHFVLQRWLLNFFCLILWVLGQLSLAKKVVVLTFKSKLPTSFNKVCLRRRQLNSCCTGSRRNYFRSVSRLVGKIITILFFRIVCLSTKSFKSFSLGTDFQRFDMLSQCLIPSVTKKAISYSLALGQQPLIDLVMVYPH